MFGNHNVKEGIKVTNITIMTAATKYGIKSLATSSILTSASRQDKNIVVPTGGVNRPKASEIKITIEKCIGSNPSWVAIGKNIGIKIKRFGTLSITVPAANKINTITSFNPQSGKPKDNKVLAIIRGMPSLISTHVKIEDVHTTSITIVVPTTASLSDLIANLKSKLRYTKKPKTNAYTAETAAASVTVAIPNTMTPTKNMGKIKVKKAPLILLNISLKVARGCRG